jgi:hypothetical protein
MDRLTNYFGQVPLETDLLKTNQNAMVGLAKFSAGVLGATTIVNGFTCTPTTPASLNVLLTAGEVYQVENLEASTWSSLTTDTHSIVKQGLLLDPLTFGITPPGTVGFSQNFLVEVQYADLDTGSTILPYFNTTPPTVVGGIVIPPLPFSGPGNLGTAQNTVRKGIAAAQVKAGIAATTGTQTTPTQDAGWTGIFVVTVANGAATITSGNITQVPNAPFILCTLPNVPVTSQSGTWTYSADTGTAGNIIATLKPIPPAYVPGLRFIVAVAFDCPGATVCNVNSLGNKAVVDTNGMALLKGAYQAANELEMVYDGTSLRIIAGAASVPDTTTGFVVSNSATQTLTNAVTLVLTLGTQAGTIGSSSGTVFTCARAGMYSVAASYQTNITFTGAANASVNTSIYKNGSVLPGITNVLGIFSPTAGSGAYISGVNTVVSLKIGDTISVADMVQGSLMSSLAVVFVQLNVTPLS